MTKQIPQQGQFLKSGEKYKNTPSPVNSSRFFTPLQKAQNVLKATDFNRKIVPESNSNTKSATGLLQQKVGPFQAEKLAAYQLNPDAGACSGANQENISLNPSQQMISLVNELEKMSCAYRDMNLKCETQTKIITSQSDQISRLQQQIQDLKAQASSGAGNCRSSAFEQDLVIQ